MPERIDYPGLVRYEIEGGPQPLGTIGIPIRDHINAATATSMITSAMRGAFGPNGSNVNFILMQGSILTSQRNQIVQEMQGDWLLFIDDDMAWQPEQVSRLLAERDKYDLDMLGGLCFRRSAPHHPTIYMREHPTEGMYNFLEDWDDDSIVECDATGMAFIVIHKRVFERMVAHYEDKPGWEMPPLDVRRQTAPPNFFFWSGQMGEDVRFCQMAKESGSKVYVHTGIEIAHLGEIAIGKREYLQEIAFRDPAVGEQRREINDRFGIPTLTREDALRKLGWVM